MRGIKLDEILPPCPKCLEESIGRRAELTIHHTSAITIRGCPVPHPRRRGYFECQVCAAVYTKKESEKYIKSKVID